MDEYEYVIQKFEANVDGVMPISLRGFSRWRELASLFAELEYKVGAEIGVEQGVYSEAMSQHNPGVKIYCIDPWITYTRYADYVDQYKLDKRREEALIRLSKYNCEIIRETSMEAVKKFEPESLDFVFIDGNHEFEFVVNDIIYWSRIVRPGGIVSGHDYKRDKNERIPFHVIQAVNAYTDVYKIRPWFLTKADKSPSWFWVKK